MSSRSNLWLHSAGAWLRRQSRWVLIVIAVVIALRAALPFVLRSLINQRLEKIPEYAGRVEEIDLHLFRGAYQLERVEIFKTTGQTREPFFAARLIDFSLAWRDLLRGRFVGDFALEEATLTIVNGPTDESSQTDTDRRWQDAIEDIFPIEITRLEIKDSSIRFIDRDADPKVDLALDNLNVVVKGLRNRPSGKRGPLPAQVDLAATTIGGGRLRLDGGLDLLAPQPRFKLNLEVVEVNLPALNDFLRAYGNVDVSRGKFQLFLEVAADAGRYEGYLKPFFDDLDFKDVGGQSEGKNIGQRLWERLVSGLSQLVKNKPRDQVATRIPFSGEFGETDVGILATIGNLLRHGFGRALAERLEGEIFAPTPESVLKPDEEKERKEENDPSEVKKEEAEKFEEAMSRGKR